MGTPPRRGCGLPLGAPLPPHRGRLLSGPIPEDGGVAGGPRFVDTHAHLDMEAFAGERDDVLARAAAAGIVHVVTVSIDLPSLRRCLELARGHDAVSATAGIHPHDAAAVTDAAWDELARAARDPLVAAIGETGLDYYRDRSPREAQRELFRRHIRLAREIGKPLVVHSRDAGEETLDILDEEGARETGGVMHCFSGDLEEARRALRLGFLLSVAGPVTYPRARLPEILGALPADHLLLETDAPYLPPQSHRGRRNEPAFLVETARAVAGATGLSLEDVARITTRNARRLFALGPSDERETLAYRIRDSLYLNATNRCTNRCVFCARETNPVVKGHFLGLDRDPSAAELVHAAGDVSTVREVVFCGFGEPLLNWEAVREAAAALKRRGAAIRINTNGQVRRYRGRDVLPEMEGIVDALSVSLNAADEGRYLDLCRPVRPAGAFGTVLDFIRDARRYVPDVTATVVALPGLDVEVCRRLARDELGVPLRVRRLNDVG